MGHQLSLNIYSVQFKLLRKQDIIENNDVLSILYPDIEGDKFQNGFCAELVKQIETKPFKTNDNTHGAKIDSSNMAFSNRIFDFILDGGLTGLEQFIIDENGDEKQKIGASDIVGHKFFIRIWMPTGNSTFVFIQKLSGLSLKPLVEDLLLNLVKNYDLRIAKFNQVTTQKRLEEFNQKSTLKYISIISSESQSDTGINAKEVEIRLKGISGISSKTTNILTKIKDVLNKHKITLEKNTVTTKGVFEYEEDGLKQERTGVIQKNGGDIQLIPGILIPNECIGSDNYPIFQNVRNFVDSEMKQLKTELNID